MFTKWNFSAIKETLLITFTDSEVVKDFRKAFDNAKREQGKIADPEYKAELEDESYFLWVSEK